MAEFIPACSTVYYVRSKYLLLKLMQRCLLSLFLLLSTASQLFAQIQSFTSGDWNSTTTWQEGVIPIATDSVIINHNVTIASGDTVEVYSLHLGQDGILDVEGTLIINTDLTMVNNEPELAAGSDALIIIRGNAFISNKVEIELSSYFIILGNFTIDGGGATDIDIDDASIYVFGEFNGGSTSLDTCNSYDGYTEDYDDICHAGTEAAFYNNAEDGIIPPQITELVSDCAPPTVPSHPSTSSISYCGIEVPAALTVVATGDDLSYQWFSNTINSNSGGTELPGEINAEYTPSTVTPGTLHFYCVVSGTCGTATSNASGAITIYDTTITSGEVGGASELTMCEGGNPPPFNVDLPSGGDGNYTYQWEESENCTGIWLNATAQDDGSTTSLTFNPPALYATICYRLKITDGCGNTGYSTIKTYNILPDPISQIIIPNPEEGTTVCVEESISAIFTEGEGGTGTVTDFYEYSIDGGSVWSEYTPGNEIVATDGMIGEDMIQIRTRREATGSGCNNGEWNMIAWSVAGLPTAPNLSASSPICPNSEAVFSITGTPGDIVTCEGASSEMVTIGAEGTINITVPDVTADISLTLTRVENPATNCSRELDITKTILVEDIEEPTFTCADAGSVFFDSFCQVTIPDLVSEITSAEDNCRTPTVTQSPVAGTVLPSHAGLEHTVTITADDGNGNTSSCHVIITGVPSSPIDIEVVDLGNFCQSGETGTTTEITWQVSLLSGTTDWTFDYAIHDGINDVVFETGIVASGNTMITYHATNETAAHKTFTLTITNVADACGTGESNTENNSDQVTVYGVPDTGNILTN
jgi:hypothetical protein